MHSFPNTKFFYRPVFYWTVFLLFFSLLIESHAITLQHHPDPINFDFQPKEVEKIAEEGIRISDKNPITQWNDSFLKLDDYLNQLFTAITETDPLFYSRNEEYGYLFKNKNENENENETIRKYTIRDIKRTFFQAYSYIFDEDDNDYENETYRSLIHLWLSHKLGPNQFHLLNINWDDFNNLIDIDSYTISMKKLLNELFEKDIRTKNAIEILIKEGAAPSDYFWNRYFWINKKGRYQLYSIYSLMKETLPKTNTRNEKKIIIEVFNSWIEEIIQNNTTYQKNVNELKANKIPYLEEQIYTLLDRIVSSDPYYRDQNNKIRPDYLKNSSFPLSVKYFIFEVRNNQMPNKGSYTNTNLTFPIQWKEITIGALLSQLIKNYSTLSKANIIDSWKNSRFVTKASEKIHRQVINLNIPFVLESSDLSFENRKKTAFQILNELFNSDTYYQNKDGSLNLKLINTYQPNNHIKKYHFSNNYELNYDAILRKLSHFLSKYSENRIKKSDLITLWKTSRGIDAKDLSKTIITMSTPLIRMIDNIADPRQYVQEVLNNLFLILNEITINTPLFKSPSGQIMPEKVTRWYFSKYIHETTYIYQFMDQTSLQFVSLMSKYSKFLNKINLTYELNLPSFTKEYLLDQWAEHWPSEWKKSNVNDFNQEQVNEVIEKYNLNPLLQIFNLDLGSILDAIIFTHKELHPDMAAKLTQLLTRSKISQNPNKESKKTELNSLTQKRNYYLRYILNQAERGTLNWNKEEIFQYQVTVFSSLFGSPHSTQEHQEVMDQINQERTEFQKQIKELLELQSSTEDPIVEIKLNLFSLLNQVYEKIYSDFDRKLNFQLPRFKVVPLDYQREAAYALISNPNGLLGDPYGSGKTYSTLFAAEYLFQKNQIQKALYITTRNNRDQVKDIILNATYTHPDEIFIPLSMNQIINMFSNESKQQWQKIKYIVLSLSLFSELKKKNENTFSTLGTETQLLILDEGHLVDNPLTNRYAAIRSLPINIRKWVITASFYQHNEKQLWVILNLLYPKEFPSFEEFISFYTQDQKGRMLLNRKLKPLMTRREGIVRYFEPPTPEQEEQFLSHPDQKTQFYRMQLEKDERGGLMPQLVILNNSKEHTAQQDKYSYELTAEQTLDILEAYEKFSDPLTFNNHVWSIMYSLTGAQAKPSEEYWTHLDAVIQDRLNRNEKIVLWCFNQKTVQMLYERYSSIYQNQFEILTFNGGTSRQKRHQFSLERMKNPQSKILIASYQSLGEGFNLPEISTSIFVQIPPGYTRFMQTMGRHQRLITQETVQWAKAFAHVILLAPKYNSKFIQELQTQVELDPSDSLNQKKLQFLLQGTPIEQLLKKMKMREIFFKEIFSNLPDRFLLEELVGTLLDVDGLLKDSNRDQLHSVHNGHNDHNDHTHREQEPAQHEAIASTCTQLIKSTAH